MRIGLLARAIVVAAADVERALEILGHVERTRGLEFDLARDAALDQRGHRRVVHRRLSEQFGRIDRKSTRLQSLMRISSAVFCLKRKRLPREQAYIGQTITHVHRNNLQSTPTHQNELATA